MSGSPQTTSTTQTSRTDWSTQPVRRRHHGSGRLYGSFLPGIVLIGLGVIFLADNYFGYTLRNWWALFILIPAFGSFANAYEALRDGDGDHAMGALIAGAGFTVLGVAFLLDLDIGRLWPVALIVVGIALLASRRGGGRWG